MKKIKSEQNESFMEPDSNFFFGLKLKLLGLTNLLIIYFL